MGSQAFPAISSLLPTLSNLAQLLHFLGDRHTLKPYKVQYMTTYRVATPKHHQQNTCNFLVHRKGIYTFAYSIGYLTMHCNTLYSHNFLPVCTLPPPPLPPRERCAFIVNKCHWCVLSSLSIRCGC